MTATIHIIWYIVWMISFVVVIQCQHVFDHLNNSNNNNINDDHIHHHDDDDIKINAMSSMGRFRQRPLLNNHHAFKLLLDYDNDDDNNTNHRVNDDVVHRGSLNMMMTGDDRELQASSILCVHNESDIRLAIKNAPTFSNTSTKITICSSYIFINASDSKGIVINNKNLEFHCHTSNVTNNCIFDMQSLSRLFRIVKSTLAIYDVDFINGNGYNDKNIAGYGGVFYVILSNFQMINCGFYNNTADYGGAIVSAVSTIKMMSSNNHKNLSSIVENNVGLFGGFIYTAVTNIEISNYNFINNTAGDGGGIYAENSTIKMISSGSHNSIVQNNVGNFAGGFIAAIDSNIEISNYDFINNTAGSGGSFVSGIEDSKLLFRKFPAFGGSIVAINCYLNLSGSEESKLLFRNNVAADYGGAISVNNCTTVLANLVFENNFASWVGGAIHAVAYANLFDHTSTLFLNNVAFSNNTSLETNDSINLEDTRISLEKTFFSKTSYNADSCDLYISNSNEDDNTYRASRINLPSSPPPQEPKPIEQQSCIATMNDLQEAVSNCDKTTIGKSCNIDICEGRLQMNSSNRDGINVSNKNIILNCQKFCPTKRCVIDGLGKSRMFYGSGYNLTILNFIFINGFHPKVGGSIRGDKDSVITILNSSFVNNTAPFGSAVMVISSRLIIEGLETSIVNNTGIGPPIQIVSSAFNISNAIFAGNNVSKYDAAVLLFNSTIQVSDVHVLSSTTTAFDYCDVFVALNGDDYGKQYSCMNIDKTNKTFPVIDVSDQCLTSAPVSASPTSTPTSSPVFPVSASPISTQTSTPASRPSTTPMPSPMSSTTKTSQPASTPSPTICFSSKNLVEIKDYGYIPISQVQIGDFVKSGNDQYSQVYGFGHLDHHYHEGTFLHLLFHSNSSNHELQIDTSSLEISPRHIVFIDINNTKISIRAANVVVGDVLSGKRIMSITTVVRRGVYAPLTQSGDIIVSGILASNYVDIIDSHVLLNQHALGHFIFTPQRWFCYYFMETCKHEIYINGYGILSYLIVRIGSIMNYFHSIVQVYFMI